MLIKCPECELQVSDKALSCPHCGYQMKQTKARVSTRMRRLPNGFGQITKLKSKNLREPYRAMVSIGKGSNGRPICKLLKPKAYFTTYNEAYAALVEYNKNPYQFDKEMTLTELYDKWIVTYVNSDKSDSAIATIRSAWNCCEPIKDLNVQQIRAYQIKGLLESESIKPTMIDRVQGLLTTLLDYAMQYEIVDKNVARIAKVSSKKHETKGHISFTDDEMKTLLDNMNDLIARMILIQCYTGFRPKELLNIKISKVDLDNLTITEGMKTEAGKDRVVPIHSKIVSLVTEEYNRAIDAGSETLFSYKGKPMLYTTYNNKFSKACENLGLSENHRPHDP